MDLDAAGRRAAVEELGLPGFRADQASRQWLGRLSDRVGEWTDVPVPARELIADALLPTLLTAVRTIDCDRGTTVKSVWRLTDGALVESVLMRYPDRVTMCISSQAGCGMNCPFCATGQAGLTRNLSTAEIVEQVLAGARALSRDEVAGGPGRVSNVVFMGMGEPLANYRAVIGAVRRLVDPQPDGFGLSARGITVSTVGLVPRMRELAHEGVPVTLAVSLHAPDDALRDTLVPVNTRWPVAEVLDAAWEYADTTHRAGQHRVRPDQGRQRSGMAGRAARRPAGGPARPREPDSAQPHARLQVDRVAEGGRARFRPHAGAAGRAGHGPRHPGP